MATYEVDPVDVHTGDCYSWGSVADPSAASKP